MPDRFKCVQRKVEVTGLIRGTTHCLFTLSPVQFNLSTALFLAIYRRLAGCPGVCRHLYSEKSTTLQGAVRELREMFDAASKFHGGVAAVLVNEGTDWVFISPNISHCSGL